MVDAGLVAIPKFRLCPGDKLLYLAKRYVSAKHFTMRFDVPCAHG